MHRHAPPWNELVIRVKFTQERRELPAIVPTITVRHRAGHVDTWRFEGLDIPVNALELRVFLDDLRETVGDAIAHHFGVFDSLFDRSEFRADGREVDID